jgi:hypothetical protein
MLFVLFKKAEILRGLFSQMEKGPLSIKAKKAVFDVSKTAFFVFILRGPFF